MKPKSEMTEMEIRFTYHAPTPAQALKYATIRVEAKRFGLVLAHLCPQSRELSLAFTKLEELVMWANSSIARRE